MQKLLTALIGPAIAALVLAAQPGAAEAQSRIKDICLLYTSPSPRD